MADSGSGRDQSTTEPNRDFNASTPSQFGQSYGIPIDSQLTMSTGYDVPQYAQELQTAATDAANPASSHENMNNSLSLDLNGAASVATTGPGMAPPQTPTQPAFVPTASRESMDAGSDSAQTPQTGDKRKRSKTSRACDECRRKKVRCDAPTEADGTPKTCTNCVKAGATCDFARKPMKRGPSKGYIKELAERVQQVEQVQQQALRQSLDAGSGVYAETFSPDDASGPMSSSHRTYSATALTSAPQPASEFRPIQFQLDQNSTTPSWINRDESSTLRTRDIGSIAIAPNEMAPTTKDQESDYRLFPEPEADPRPSKRLRLDPEVPVEDLSELLSKYSETVNRTLPLFPRAVKTVNGVLGNAEVSLQHAFAAALSLLPGLTATTTTTNGDHGAHVDPAINRVKRNLKTTAFESYGKLEELIKSEMTEAPDSRSLDDNLLFGWTLVILALVCENQVDKLTAKALSKSDLLDNGARVATYLRARKDDPENSSFIDDPAEFASAVDKVFNCVAVLTKFHYFDLAIVPSVGQPFNLELIVRYGLKEEVPAEASFLGLFSNMLGGVIKEAMKALDDPSLPWITPEMFFYPMFDQQARLLEPDLDEMLVKQCRYLMDLALSFHQIDRAAPGPGPVLDSSLKLANTIIRSFESANSEPYFNPMDMHTWSFVTMILCQFVHCVRDKALAERAIACLNALRDALKKKSESFHKTYGFEWFFAPDGTNAHSYKMTPWTDKLVAMVNYCQDNKVVPAFANQGQDGLVVPYCHALMVEGFLGKLVRFPIPNEG